MTSQSFFLFSEAVADLPDSEAVKLKEKLEVLNSMDAEV